MPIKTKPLSREGQRRLNAKNVKAALREARKTLGTIKPKLMKSLNPGDRDRLSTARTSLRAALEDFWSDVRQ